jgi:hypothetical protein
MNRHGILGVDAVAVHVLDPQMGVAAATVVLTRNIGRTARPDAVLQPEIGAVLGDPLRPCGPSSTGGMRSFSSRRASDTNRSGGIHGMSIWQSAEILRYSTLFSPLHVDEGCTRVLSEHHSSGIPALRSPAKYVASNKARIFGISTPKFLIAFKRAMLE